MKNKLSLITSVYFAPTVLFLAAVLTFTAYIFTNRSDMTSALLLLAGFMLLITGILLLTLADRQPLPVKLTEALPVAGTLNIATILADLGITSNTIHRHLPSGEHVQINPVTGGQIPALPKDVTFVSTGDWNGVQYRAMGSTILQLLKNADNLVIPSGSIGQLGTCISEVMNDTLSLAEKVTVATTDKSVIITLDGFAMKKTCLALQAQSPKCCTMVGCPICSLMAAILAEGAGRDVESTSVVLNGSTLTVSFALLPPQ
jgi:hypothetical protein